MRIKKAAIAGTLESSDCMVTVEPVSKGTGIQFELNSAVIHQFGDEIKATVFETLERLDIEDARIIIIDKGALDCTIKARVECAVFRSNNQKVQLPWGGVIR